MSIMHTASLKWQTAKPMVFALAVGLVAGPLFSNYMGWQVTGGTARTQMRAGIVEAEAMICNARARLDVSEPGKLDWSARNDLAKKWAVMPGATTAESDVTSACSGKLAG
jgi:hypothetical protein